MRTAVDSSVLLDVILNDPGHGPASEKALREAADHGALLIGECVLAEIRPALSNRDLLMLLQDWNLDFIPSSRESSLLAGEMFATHLRRKKGASRVLPDFLIGAHAQIHADRLLARDRGYYRDYFTRLKLVEP